MLHNSCVDRTDPAALTEEAVHLPGLLVEIKGHIIADAKGNDQEETVASQCAVGCFASSSCRRRGDPPAHFGW